ncbi:MAG: NADH-quinone oxidoreductase subunit J family protein [Gemmataceae bacterium]
MALTDVLFYLLAAMTGVCALAVVMTQNIVRAAAWLLFTLAGVSGLCFLLGADFVGATQLLVYVGGTLVLVVFGVMLTAQGPFINMRIGAAEWAIALSVGLILYGILAASRIVSQPMQPAAAQASNAEMADSTVLGQALLGQKQTAPPGDLSGVPSGVRRERTRMSYLLPFEIVSVHLLVVLIGAAYLARAKRRRSAAAPGREQQLGVTV